MVLNTLDRMSQVMVSSNFLSFCLVVLSFWIAYNASIPELTKNSYFKLNKAGFQEALGLVALCYLVSFGRDLLYLNLPFHSEEFLMLVLVIGVLYLYKVYDDRYNNEE